MPPNQRAELTSSVPAEVRSSKATTGRLTQREREVLRLAADGLSSEKIGERLFLSPQTVRGHVGNAMGKLQAHTRTQAVATALRKRLIA